MLDTAIDLKRLKTFYLVAKHGSLREAAARQTLSTSAVSIQINQLETELGVKLFSRAGRKMALAPAGETFLSHVEAVFDALDAAVASVSDIAPTRRRIAIAVGTDLTRVFAKAIGEFMRAHPDVEIALQLKHSRESLARVLEGEIDMAVGYFGTLPKDLEKRTLMKSGFTMSFAATHPAAKLAKPSIRDLAAYPVISLRKETDIGKRVLRAFEEAGASPANFLEVGNCQSSQDLAAQSIGIAFAHKTCLSGYKSSEMCTIDATRLLGSVDVAVVLSKRRAVSVLQHELIEEMHRVAPTIALPAVKAS